MLLASKRETHTLSLLMLLVTKRETHPLSLSMLLVSKGETHRVCITDRVSFITGARKYPLNTYSVLH